MMTAAERQRAYRERNKEKVQAADRARKKAAYAADSAAAKERVRLWRLENPDYNSEYMKRYRAENMDKVLEHCNKRRAIKLGATVEDFTRVDIIELYGTDCHICHEPIDLTVSGATGSPGWERGLHIDHVVALANGGAHSLENCRPSHGLCNLRKNAKVA